MAETDGETPPSRAQLLATEHWSLLASRSTTQSEVLVRINMFLTLVSAGLVSLALVGQAMGFDDTFRLFSIAVLAFICVVGLLTQVRVLNVGEEDLMYVLAMNRLRGAYVQLDPGVDPFLMASRHDDEAGTSQTYFFLGHRSSFSQLAGSSMIFIIAVVSMLLGLLAATITAAFGAGLGLAVTIGVAVGLAHALAAISYGARRYFTFWRSYRPLMPTPPPPPSSEESA
jgi:hypothetical protein